MFQRLISLVITGVAVVLVTSACTTPEAREGALPVDMRTAPVPPVGANAYIYVRPTENPTFTSEMLGVDGLTLESAEALLADGSDGVAARFITSARKDVATPRVVNGRWVDAGSTSLRVGPDSEWGEVVRGAWNRKPTKSFSEQFPGAWDDLQAMPQSPPARPIAAGFVRNFGTLIERMLGEAHVIVPNLADGLALVRINSVAFVAYSDDFTHVPDRVEPSVLRDLNVSILAVADSSYPSAVVGQVFGGFVSALGLSTIVSASASATAYQRQLTDDIHVVVMRDGRTLFFAVGATLEKAEDVIEAVVSERSKG